MESPVQLVLKCSHALNEAASRVSEPPSERPYSRLLSVRWKWRPHLTAAAGTLFFEAKCNYQSRNRPRKQGLMLPSSHEHLGLSEWLQQDVGFYASIQKVALCETQLRTSRLQGHWFIATRGKDLLLFPVNLVSLRVEVGIRGDSQSMKVVKEAMVTSK